MNFSPDEREKRMRDQSRNHSQRCLCEDKSGIFLTGRRVSWLVSSIIMISFFVFISGYFLGKRKAVEKFYRKIEQDSFADHVYYSMCSMYDRGGVAQQGQSGTAEDQDDSLALATENEIMPVIENAVDVADSQVIDVSENTSTIADSSLSLDNVDNKDDVQYYAELIGFGTHRAARKFADKMLQDNISVSVKKRRGKTARGKVIVWYQVVTENFSNKGDLIALVDDISAQERLKDVRIVSC